MRPLLDVWAACSGRSRRVLALVGVVWMSIGATLGQQVSSNVGLVGGDAVFAVLAGAVVVPVVLAGLVSMSIIGAAASGVAH